MVSNDIRDKYIKFFVSRGHKQIPAANWKSLGVVEDHIFFYGVDKNWWSRCGPPDRMPAGEIVGPGEGSKPRDVLVRNAEEYFAQSAGATNN